MSYQTKEQSIGYLLHGALKCEKLPASELVTIALEAVDVVPKSTNLINDDTLKFIRIIGEKIKLDEEQVKQWKSEVYWAFDMRTVEEAQHTFDAFAQLFPVLRN